MAIIKAAHNIVCATNHLTIGSGLTTLTLTMNNSATSFKVINAFLLHDYILCVYYTMQLKIMKKKFRPY